MRIATYNVNGVNGRLPVLLRWLEESSPGIVCLQELKAPQERFPEKAIHDLGYDAVWLGQKSWNGVAILSRVGQIHETRRGLPGDPDPSHHLLLSLLIADRLIDAQVDLAVSGWEKTSDHAAVWIKVSEPEPERLRR